MPQGRFCAGAGSAHGASQTFCENPTASHSSGPPCMGWEGGRGQALGTDLDQNPPPPFGCCPWASVSPSLSLLRLSKGGWCTVGALGGGASFLLETLKTARALSSLPWGSHLADPAPRDACSLSRCYHRLHDFNHHMPPGSSRPTAKSIRLYVTLQASSHKNTGLQPPELLVHPINSVNAYHMQLILSAPPHTPFGGSIGLALVTPCPQGIFLTRGLSPLRELLPRRPFPLEDPLTMKLSS